MWIKQKNEESVKFDYPELNLPKQSTADNEYIHGAKYVLKARLCTVVGA